MAKYTSRSNPLDEFSAERDERPSAETIEKLQWVTQQYDALLPDDQAAVDAVLVALNRRPVSELSAWSIVHASPPCATGMKSPAVTDLASLPLRR